MTIETEEKTMVRSSSVAQAFDWVQGSHSVRKGGDEGGAVEKLTHLPMRPEEPGPLSKERRERGYRPARVIKKERPSPQDGGSRR